MHITNIIDRIKFVTNIIIHKYIFMEYNIIKHTNETNRILLTFSPYRTKYILPNIEFPGDNIQLKDSSNKFYFTKNKMKIFKQLTKLCLHKHVVILSTSKGGYVSIECAKYLEKFSSKIDIFVFNPMLILDKYTLDNSAITYPPTPPSLLKFTQEYTENIPNICDILTDHSFNFIYTYSTKSIIDNLNFEYVKKYVNYYLPINIESHNCLYPFLKNVDANSKIDCDGYTIATYSKSDVCEIQKLFGDHTVITLDSLINTQTLFENNFTLYSYYKPSKN